MDRVIVAFNYNGKSIFENIARFHVFVLLLNTINFSSKLDESFSRLKIKNRIEEKFPLSSSSFI